ncbi:MAG TPA: ABC transporter substrate-binding protein [Bacillota bacterium]|nr:ABC transporter substrate-binding protein [Bacillota bacterium]
MKQTKKALLTLIILILVSTFCSCGFKAEQQPSNAPSQGSNTQSLENQSADSQNLEFQNSETQNPETLTPEIQSNYSVFDSRGVEVFFERTPERIISLMPSNTEILYALNCGSSIVAVSDYCNYPEDTNNKQKLSTGEVLNVEAIIALDAQAVILGNMSAMEDQINQLERAGVKVVVTEANSLLQTYEVIEMIGNTMGRKAEAQLLIKDMKNGFEGIRKQANQKDPIKIFVEVSPLEYGLWSCGKNTFIHELIEIVGAKNIFENIEGWSAVSEEEVLTQSPDIIITTASSLTGIEDPVGQIKSRENWGNIQAVKNNKVAMIDADMATRPGPRLLDAAKELINIME